MRLTAALLQAVDSRPIMGITLIESGPMRPERDLTLRNFPPRKPDKWDTGGIFEASTHFEWFAS
jgi:hypothetical protein